MKVKAITFGKTINIGNYQSVKVEITVEAENDEKAIDIYEKSKIIYCQKRTGNFNQIIKF